MGFSFTSNTIRARILPTLVTVFLLVSATAMAQPDGKAVFKTNCASCHNRNMVDPMTGPALDGAFERIQDAHGFSEQETIDWMTKWIHNSQAMIASGDEYAKKIYQEFNQTQMTSFISLPDEEVHAVIDYIRNWDTEKYQTVAKGPETGPGGGGAQAASGPALSTNLILIILVIVLLIIALILARVTNVLGRVADSKETGKVPEERPFYLNKKFITVLILAVVVLLGFRVVDGAIALGRQQNYSPEQPIAFSHKLHAGINQIDCKYCHIGVERGKQATIPPPSICMNCHKYVKQGPDKAFKEQNGLRGPGNDTTQIAKIYAAIGWDPKSQTYDESKQKPIEWVRIHNLPDHVYFNHSQHVKVGGIQCQTCHGPVQEMDKVYQFAPLSMGWCISCHRKTDVQFTNNSYYDNYYKDYHQALESGDIGGVTVEMIGGTSKWLCFCNLLVQFGLV